MTNSTRYPCNAAFISLCHLRFELKGRTAIKLRSSNSIRHVLSSFLLCIRHLVVMHHASRKHVFSSGNQIKILSDS